MSSHHLLDDDSDLLPRRDREVTLSTGAILAIFFGLVLLCGLFFALGYNMHKSAPPLAATGDTAADSSSSSASSFSHFNKPSAGSPGGVTAPAPSAAPAATNTPVAPPASTPATAVPVPAATTETAAPEAAAARTTPAPSTHAAQPAAVSPAAPAVVAPGPGTFMVQIAAVSHQEDASLLVGALKSKGYAVSAHTEPQDKLFHIQVGPFATKKDADTMRQRLLADGYNAIVK